MKNKILRLCLSVLFSLLLFAGCKKNETVIPQVTSSGNENGKASVIQNGSSVFVANYFLEAPANTDVDSSIPLQELLNIASENGGGTVYLKSGIYKLYTPIKVPENVSLKGDFTSPEKKTSSSPNTVLIVANSENNKNAPFITVQSNSVVSGFTVKYEAQSYTNPVEYPFVFEIKGVRNVSLENIYLPDCHEGINIEEAKDIGLKNVYITSFSYGVKTDKTAGHLTLQDVNISPIYLLNEQYLPVQTDFDDSAIRESISLGAIGIYIGDCEAVSLYGCSVDSAKIGIYLSIPKESEGSVLAAKLDTVNCSTALYVESAGQNGFIFESSNLGATGLAASRCVYMGTAYTSEAIFSSCSFSGFPNVALKSEGKGLTQIINCKFNGWHKRAYETTDEAMASLFSYYGISKSLGSLENYSVAMFIDSVFQTETLIEGGNYIQNDKKTEYEIPEADLSGLYFTDTIAPINARVIKASDFGVTPESEDIGAALQTAINQAKKEGAGIVLIDAGEYKMKTPVVLAENIYLIGAGKNTNSSFSTKINCQVNAIGGSALFVMAKNSALSDIAFSCTDFSDSPLLYGEAPKTPSTYIIKADGVSSIKLTNLSFNGVPNGAFLKNISKGYISSISGSSIYKTLVLENNENVIIENLNINSEVLGESNKAYSAQNGVALEISGGEKISLINNHFENINTAISLLGTAKTTSVGLYAKGIKTTFKVGNAENALFINSFSAPTEGTHIYMGNGKATFFGLVSGGTPAVPVNISNGKAEIFGSVFNRIGSYAVKMSNGSLDLYGSVFPVIPEGGHIDLSGGEAVMMGNIVRSAKYFEALNIDYMKATVSGGKYTEEYSIKGYDTSGEGDDESSENEESQ